MPKLLPLVACATLATTACGQLPPARSPCATQPAKALDAAIRVLDAEMVAYYQSVPDSACEVTSREQQGITGSLTVVSPLCTEDGLQQYETNVDRLYRAAEYLREGQVRDGGQIASLVLDYLAPRLSPLLVHDLRGMLYYAIMGVSCGSRS